MRKSWKIVLLLVASISAPRSVPAAGIDEQQVRAAIERATAYLLREQREDGSWSDQLAMPGGISGLVVLALLNAGVPSTDPQMQKALRYIDKLDPDMTYSKALQTMVLCVADPKQNLLRIRRNVQSFEQQQIRSMDKNGPNMQGAWDYGRERGSGDGSNSQFALLALHEAERVGVTVSQQTWRMAADYWKRSQNADGSWGYHPGDAGTGSMTCAGIAAVIITSDKLTSGDATVANGRVACCGQQQPNESLERALAWLSSNFKVDSNPGREDYVMYYLYGLERVGRLTNQRFIGQHDWYREGADRLISAQEMLSGFWTGSGLGEGNPHVATSMALLFLAKGRRPILASKLKHLPADDWNHHRSDLSNLTTYTERRWGRDLTWQVIDSAVAEPIDLIQSPVIYISGQLAPQFTDDQVRRLREYVNMGGFLFADACCGGGEFDEAFRVLVKRIFPEPEYDLRLLPPEHPVWTAEERIDPQHLRPLYGVDIGCRTSVIYCPENLSCYWELSRPGRNHQYPPEVQTAIQAAMSLGINVLAYATNRELRYKLDLPLAAVAGPDSTFDRARLHLAKIRHAGGADVAPAALANLLRVLSDQAGIRVSTDVRELTLADEKLFDYHLVFLHGRQAFRLSDEERKQLRTFVERGGIVFADAVCASEQFAASLRAEVSAALPDRPWERIPAEHPLLSTQYGGFDLKTVMRRDPRRRNADGALDAAPRRVQPELEGIRIGERYGVIFSPYDLSCALERHESLECPGYTREDAARIGLNIIMYSLYE